MKLTRRISAVIGAFGVIVLLSRWLAVPMADWAVPHRRGAYLAALFVLAITTARMRSQQKPEEKDENRT